MKLLVLLLTAAWAAFAQDHGPGASPGHCVPQKGHWHCPLGVSEPPYLPPSRLARRQDVDNENVCEPHGDHWHCPSGVPEPTTPTSDVATSTHDHSNEESHLPSGSCIPHHDHWHCPSGVPEPTISPAQTPPPAGSTTPLISAPISSTPTVTDLSMESHAATTTPGATTACSWHNTSHPHWDCPNGVPEPSGPPSGVTLSTIQVVNATATRNVTSPVPSQHTGAAGSGIAINGAMVAAVLAIFGCLL